MYRFYGRPSLTEIDEYEQELIELMQYNAIDEITYGFKKDSEWITAVKYKSVNGSLISDDVPGAIRAGFDVERASLYSYLIYGAGWWALSQSERDRIESRLPIKRSGADEPSVKDGYWSQDRSYSAGGRALQRSSIRRY